MHCVQKERRRGERSLNGSISESSSLCKLFFFSLSSFARCRSFFKSVKRRRRRARKTGKVVAAAAVVCVGVGGGGVEWLLCCAIAANNSTSQFH